MNLIDSYNYWLVALSVLIAIFASYAALDLAGRVTATVGWTRAVWLLGGAVAMGSGGGHDGIHPGFSQQKQDFTAFRPGEHALCHARCCIAPGQNGDIGISAVPEIVASRV